MGHSRLPGCDGDLGAQGAASAERDHGCRRGHRRGRGARGAQPPVQHLGHGRRVRVALRSGGLRTPTSSCCGVRSHVSGGSCRICSTSVDRLRSSPLSVSSPTFSPKRSARRRLSPKSGTLAWRCREEGRRIELVADRRRLVQVFQNLIDNAIQFSPSGGGSRFALGAWSSEFGRLRRVHGEGLWARNQGGGSAAALRAVLHSSAGGNWTRAAHRKAHRLRPRG